MKRIESLSDLNKHIKQYKVQSNPDLIKYEKETHVSVFYNNNDKPKMAVFTDHRTGIKWAIDLINEYNAKLKHLYLNDGAIVSISIETDIVFFTLKGTPRATNNMSSIFSSVSKGCE